MMLPLIYFGLIEAFVYMPDTNIFIRLAMQSYKADEKLQTATVVAALRLLELNEDKLKERNEELKITMIKSADCKTQAVCDASVLKCKGCGTSLSLMEGKNL